MNIGIPKEIKDHEFRIALSPDGVAELIHHGHEVWIESTAGEGSGFPDTVYQNLGAKIAAVKEEVFDHAELILKVKEPLLSECSFFKPHHTLFTYLHLAASKDLTKALMATGITAIAYETTETVSGALPMLTPMSQIAGRMSVQIAAHFLEKPQGGKGLLLGGITGVRPAHVMVLGAGGVGAAAVQIAVGMGARVTVLSVDTAQLSRLDELYRGRVVTLSSTQSCIDQMVPQADVLIGAAMVRGARTPFLVSRKLVGQMEPGSVIVDVAVDQGGCVETTHPTTHSDPVYKVDGVLHYAVTNIPGIVPYTSTYALTHATLPFIVRLLESGIDQALYSDPGFAKGVNVREGRVTYQAVAEAHGLPYEPCV